MHNAVLQPNIHKRVGFMVSFRIPRKLPRNIHARVRATRKKNLIDPKCLAFLFVVQAWSCINYDLFVFLFVLYADSFKLKAKTSSSIFVVFCAPSSEYSR